MDIIACVNYKAAERMKEQLHNLVCQRREIKRTSKYSFKNSFLISSFIKGYYYDY